jgi:glycosyltransferase involved in cell wall biosynthesis
MNILLIHQYFLEKGDGGGSRFNEMTRNWSENGHSVTVLAGMVHYATGKKIERYKGKWTYMDNEFYPGVDVIRCHVSESYNINFLGRLWAYFSFVFSSIWAGLFKAKGHYNIILVTSPPLFVAITAYVLSRLKRLPFIFEIRDLWPESAIDTGVLKSKLIIRFSFWFEKFVYKKAILINVLTPAFREKLILDKKVLPEKIFFIPNAADFSLSEKIERDLNVHQFRKEHELEGKFVITYVGAHGVANHLIQLVDAAEQLQDTNVLFLFIGAGMKKQELQDNVRDRKIENIKFIDSVSKEEVFKYIFASEMGTSVLKKVDAFKTIYSNKTFDYMSCKKPILLAIDGVSRQLIEDAKCGYYVEPENIEDIVQTIRIIMKEPEKLTELGLNGYYYSKQNFDRNHLALEYLKKIETVSRKIGNV